MRCPEHGNVEGENIMPAVVLGFPASLCAFCLRPLDPRDHGIYPDGTLGHAREQWCQAAEAALAKFPRWTVVLASVIGRFGWR
jgi:hypothetical protein